MNEDKTSHKGFTGIPSLLTHISFLLSLGLWGSLSPFTKKSDRHRFSSLSYSTTIP